LDKLWEFGFNKVCSFREMSLGKRAFIVTLGSYGDLHPFLSLGQILKDMGFKVLFFANDTFQRDVESCSLEFRSIGPVSEYEELVEKARPDKAIELAGILAEYLVIKPMERTYNAIVDSNPNGKDLLVIHPLAIGAKLVAETHDLKVLVCQLSPYGLPSAKSPTRIIPGVDFSFLPEWILDAGISMAYRLMDLPLAGPLNELRTRLNLPKISRIYPWVLDCDLVLGLFPQWFAPPQPDWPQNLKLATFPLYKESTSMTLPSGLEEFLEAGDAPILFTQGTPNARADSFFNAAVEVCLSMGIRGIFLSPHIHKSLESLPEGLIHFPFVPMETLLPAVRAIVHHGGIGTSARALHAGKPQVIVPWGVDQFDNAHRLNLLGVGCRIELRFMLQRKLRSALKTVLEDEIIEQNCANYARLLQERDAEKVIRTALEEFLFNHFPSIG
jgi:rhamnosyltransferase subunit B